MSLQDIADALDSKRATVQRYFKDEYQEGGTLPVPLAMKLAVAFAGKGEPPITKDEVLDLTGLPQVADERGGHYAQLPYEVVEAMAETAARLALRGQEPPADVVEAITRTLSELSALYEHDPSARHDAGQTRGALKVLSRRFAPRGS